MAEETPPHLPSGVTMNNTDIQNRSNTATLANAVELICQTSLAYMGTKHTTKTPVGGSTSRQVISDAATARIRMHTSVQYGA